MIDVAVPPNVVKLTEPLDPRSTLAVICVSELTVKLKAGVPPKLTAVAPVKLVPVITTALPLPAEVGAKDVMAGAGTNTNPAIDAAPPGVVTLIEPDEPLPTTAIIPPPFVSTKILWAGVLPKLTWVAPVNPAPDIKMYEPWPPELLPVEIFSKEFIVGGG